MSRIEAKILIACTVAMLIVAALALGNLGHPVTPWLVVMFALIFLVVTTLSAWRHYFSVPELVEIINSQGIPKQAKQEVAFKPTVANKIDDLIHIPMWFLVIFGDIENSVVRLTTQAKTAQLTELGATKSVNHDDGGVVIHYHPDHDHALAVCMSTDYTKDEISAEEVALWYRDIAPHKKASQ